MQRVKIERLIPKLTKVNTIQRRVNEANFSANLTRLNITNQSTSGTGEKLPVGKRLPINQSTFSEMMTVWLRIFAKDRARETEGKVETGLKTGERLLSSVVRDEWKRRVKEGSGETRIHETLLAPFLASLLAEIVLNFSLDRSSLFLSLSLSRARALFYYERLSRSTSLKTSLAVKIAFSRRRWKGASLTAFLWFSLSLSISPFFFRRIRLVAQIKATSERRRIAAAI